ncbi:MAG: endonuclease/exonuclease/phosphatase family protein [Bradymonadaceae bacterium]
MRRILRFAAFALLAVVVAGVVYGLLREPASGPRPAPGPFPEDSGYTRVDDPPEELSLATWNLRWLNRPGRGEVDRSPADFRRLARVAEAVDADVVAVQEVYDRRALERVFDPKVYAFYLSRRWAKQRTGFVVKRGLTVERHDDYRRLAAVGGGDRRGVDLSLQLSGGALRLLSIHLSSGCIREEGVPATNPDCRDLLEQAKRLGDWIRRREEAGEEFAILGDFNRDYAEGDPIWSELERAASRVGTSLVRAGRGESPSCWDARYPTYIDHLVFDADVTEDWQIGSFEETTYESVLESREGELSDHCPLAVTLKR